MATTYKTKIKILGPAVRFLWPLRIINKQRFIEGKGVYVCNHYGIMDANALCGYLFHDKINIVMKHDSYKGILKPFMKAVNAIPIHRGEADMRAIKNCVTVLRKNEPLLIFPEGTRNKTDDPKTMLPIKEGAALFALKTNAPIIPLLYYDCSRMFKRTFLNIGEPIYCDDLHVIPNTEARDILTQRMIDSFKALRIEIDNIVEDKTARKKAIKESKAYAKFEKRQLKEAKRLEHKQHKQLAAPKEDIHDVQGDKENINKD